MENEAIYPRKFHSAVEGQYVIVDQAGAVPRDPDTGLRFTDLSEEFMSDSNDWIEL